MAGATCTKAVALGPFHNQALDLAHRLTGDPTIDARMERLRYFDLDPQLLDQRSVMNDPAIMRRKRMLLLETLERMPGHIVAASQLLQLDYYSGTDHPRMAQKLHCSQILPRRVETQIISALCRAWIDRESHGIMA